MKLSLTPTKVLFIGIVFFGSFFRFFNPLWDNGLFLHPDERLFINASNLSLPTSLTQFFSSNSPLNPHMFYYGSLLLYVYKLASLVSPFSLLETSRIISAFFSSLTITFVFLIGKKLFSNKVGLLSALIFACSVGSIQYAHFNTTESFLILLISVITYVDIISVQKKNPKFLLLSLLLVGIAVATKITGLLFGLSSLTAALLLIKERVSIQKVVVWFIMGSLIGAVISLVLTPYQLIDFHDFFIQQSYMQGVTYGTFKPPFVLIYQNTIPYLYQFLHVFPFAVGFLTFPLSLIGCFVLMRSFIKNWKQHTLYLFLLVFPLLYFAWSGNWFAKFARYYVLLIPFLSIWAAFLLRKFSKVLQALCVIFIIGNALLFMRIYFPPNTRVMASAWIYSHLPKNAVIATEHWDDALPLVMPNESPIFQHETLTVYDPETSEKLSTLSQTIAHADYIILSSRRVYASIEENTSMYPATATFYKKLFSQTLGFEKIYSVTNYPFFFSDDYADETFQSYDHPPVIIFHNKKHLSASQILTSITSQ